MDTLDNLRTFIKNKPVRKFFGGGGLGKEDLMNIRDFEMSDLISLDDTE
jgi:hypothetical protein